MKDLQQEALEFAVAVDEGIAAPHGIPHMDIQDRLLVRRVLGHRNSVHKVVHDVRHQFGIIDVLPEILLVSGGGRIARRFQSAR